MTRLPRRAVDRLLELGAEPETASDPGLGIADLGRYRLIRELGRGGMGRVYEAEDTQLRRLVALKLMPETVGLSEVMRRRFAREAKAVAKLSHPNIAAVYDATPDYIAMQLVDGRSIFEMPRQPELIATLVRDAALAVQYAHECGVIHRDLKPSNLMVEAEESGSPASKARVFVLDFGLAKEAAIESSLSLSGNIVGTPSFMPPEQAEGRSRDVDARSDVYGLGATLFACLTGEPPFEDPEVFRLLGKVVEEEARPPRIEPDLDAIVLMCLAKEPERRYQTAGALAEDLTRWLRGDSVVAQPPSWTYRLRKFVARRRALVRTAAVAAGAALAIAALVLVPLAVEEKARREGADSALRLSRGVEANLVNAQVLFRRGLGKDIEQAQGLLDSSAQDCRVFLEQYETADGFYLLGRVLRYRGMKTQSREALDRAIELVPDHRAARFERGLLLLSEHRLALGQRNLDPAAPPDPELERRIADLAAVIRGDLEAFDVHDDYRIVDKRYAAAELQHLAGNLELARDELLQVLELESENAEVRLALARVYSELGNHEKATEYSAGSLDLRFGFAPIFLSRSQVGAEPKPDPDAGADVSAAELAGSPVSVADLDWVLSDFTDVLKRRSLSAPMLAEQSGLEQITRAAGLTALGETEAAMAAWQEAILHLDSMLKVHPRLVGAFVNRGACRGEVEKLLLAQGRTLDAIAVHRGGLADCDEAIRLAPEFAPGWFDRALLRMHQAERLAAFGRYPPATLELEQAASDFTECLRLDADNADALFQRGLSRERLAVLLRRQGDEPRADQEREGAVADLRRALAAAKPDWQRRAACESRLAQLAPTDRR